ncbi:MAG: hypothetical protein HOC71_13900 [Candidatus Latescibacteria bacterium]|jgi:periplasmic protein CpxP/Spy|nr:hypothetical protein [Candidatus Latescibacterota bacterium]
MRKNLLSSLILAMILALMFSSNVFSQQRSPRRQRLSPEQMKERISKNLEDIDKALDLTDEQKTQLEALFNQDLPREPASQSQSRSERMANFRASRQQRGRRGEEIQKILTPEQYKKYQNLQQNQRIDSRLDMLVKGLELTDEQKTKIRGILERNDEMMRELMSQSSDDRNERFSAMRTMREKTDKAIEDVLTESQAKKYRDMQEQQRSRMRRPRE